MIVIGGATATGKSALGMEVARRIGGEIIGADSLQIYKQLDIGTSKPTQEDRVSIPHHMIDIVEPWETYSVARYQEDAREAIESIKNRGKVPIVVGGTGLYVNALLYEYKPSERDEGLRETLLSEYREKGASYMYAKLRAVDEKAAQNIHPNNVKRVIRALEVKLLTGQSIADKNDKESTIPCLTYVCSFERETLYRIIDARVEQMIAQGLEEEVRSLLKDGKVTFASQSMQGIGYKEFSDYFKGEKTWEQTVEIIQQHTRNYAKRQITWFKRLEDAIWLKNDDIDRNANRIAEDYYHYFCKL